MKPLDQVYTKIVSVKSSGSIPLVVFDLDDTIIDCRHRKMFVLREFCSLDQSQTIWPTECKAVLSAKLESYEYKINDFLMNISIDNSEFQEALEKFWFSKYFSNPYLSADKFFPGALESIEKMRALGAEIRYFTGRDETGMREGTEKKLKENGLNDKVFMKPSVEIPDDRYKVDYFDEVINGFELVCFFENELRNLNPFVDKFPESLFIWLDTLYSPNQPEKHKKILTMKSWN